MSGKWFDSNLVSKLSTVLGKTYVVLDLLTQDFPIFSFSQILILCFKQIPDGFQENLPRIFVVSEKKCNFEVSNMLINT